MIMLAANSSASTMKAVVADKYGSWEVLQYREDVSKPVPSRKQVLVKVYTTSLNAADWHLMKGDPYIMRLAFGIFKPKLKILGADVAGTVESLGADAGSKFQVGDEVVGCLSDCSFGGLAEYVCVDPALLVKKPSDTLGWKQAASLPLAGVTALQALRLKQPRQGDKVLINGASGGVGSYAVQLAKHFGAEVTATSSQAKMDFVKSLGADHVIDYATVTGWASSPMKYDFFFDNASKGSISDCAKALAAGGLYVAVGGDFSNIIKTMLVGSFVGGAGRCKSFLSVYKPEDLEELVRLVTEGKITPPVDPVAFNLQQARDAMKYLLDGKVKGKVVISVVP